MSDWEQLGAFECKNCGHLDEHSASFISDFFAPKICPKCGEFEGWWKHTYTERVVYTGQLFKPWTWLRLERQVKDIWTNKPKQEDDNE